MIMRSYSADPSGYDPDFTTTGGNYAADVTGKIAALTTAAGGALV